MDDLFELHADHVFLRREALEHGYRDSDLAAMCRAGVLAKVRHGAYVDAKVWGAKDELQRHLLRAHAVLRSHDAPVALSHTTAAAEHGLRLFRPELGLVHVTPLGRSMARTTPGVAYHRGGCPDAELQLVNAHLCVSPTRASLGAAVLTGVEGGLVVLDSLLDLGLGDEGQLARSYEAFQGQPQSRRLQITVRLVRRGSGSTAETRARYLMWRQHVPEPVLQFEVRDERGNLVGRTDFAWPEYGVLGEIDGLVKYDELRRPGETPRDALAREKRREDRLRELTGWLMVRMMWRDLDAPRRTAERILQSLERGRRALR